MTYPDGSLVAVDPSDSQPGRQIKHVLKNLFIKLQIGQLSFPLQCTQVYLVRGQVLCEPKGKKKFEKTNEIDKRTILDNGFVQPKSGGGSSIYPSFSQIRITSLGHGKT